MLIYVEPRGREFVEKIFDYSTILECSLSDGQDMDNCYTKWIHLLQKLFAFNKIQLFVYNHSLGI